jgi:hypothetical protein
MRSNITIVIDFLDISVVAARKALLKLIDVIKHLLLSAFYTIYTIKIRLKGDFKQVSSFEPFQQIAIFVEKVHFVEKVRRTKLVWNRLLVLF